MVEFLDFCIGLEMFAACPSVSFIAFERAVTIADCGGLLQIMGEWRIVLKTATNESWNCNFVVPAAIKIGTAQIVSDNYAVANREDVRRPVCCSHSVRRLGVWTEGNGHGMC
ncbi:hypothetical protein AAC387_Pa01g2084 [Persea americana]